MPTKLAAALAVIFLLGACEQSQPVAAPPSPPPAAPPQVYTVLFATGSSALSAQARGTIQQAVAAYQSAPGAGVTVTGHTDTVGSPNLNQALSQRRARVVTDALIGGGVPAAAISSTGTGETSLPVQTADNVNEQRNRRVDITVARRVAAGMSDADYCAALSAKYRQFRPSQADETAAAAMYQCQAGNTATGIPVLERILTDARIPLPSRT